ncbi:MAG: hypothetical protein ABI083_09785 [Lapillicoccus sp.]
MATPYRLRPGDVAPVQHSSTTCGSASLTVARMLVDPVFAGWVEDGTTAGHGFLPELTDSDKRLAAAEQLVLARTNRLLGPGSRVQLPWPRTLGTPPWGARNELEHGASRPGTRYETRWCRLGGPSTRRAHLQELIRRVTPGRPAALYVGNATLPRHVTLLVPGEGPGQLTLYDPATGTATALDPEAFVARRLRVAGWDVPWCSVRPRADQV